MTAVQTMVRPDVDRAGVPQPTRSGESDPSRPAGPAGSSAPSGTTAALVVVLLSYFMILLDSSIIFTGLPTIQRGLGLSATGMAWVQDAYTLVFGGLLLLGGRLGDILGRRRVFMAGLALFGTASLLVGLAQSGAWIISARALQGVGAAVIAPSSLAILTDLFPEGPARTRATAAYGTTAGLGASLGLPIGGAITALVSWRAGFFINVPIAILMIIASLRVLPRFEAQRGGLDIMGALTSTLGIGAVVYGVITSSSDPSAALPIALLGLVLVAVFVLHERRAAQPLMPLRVLADRGRAGAALARLLLPAATIGVFLYTAQWLQDGLGWSALGAGLGFLVMTLPQFTASTLVNRLTARLGRARLLVLGLVVQVLGSVWLALLPAGAGFAAAIIPLALVGIGQGLAFGPLTAAGVAGVRASDAGAASGVVNTVHQAGLTLGLAIITAVTAGGTVVVERVGTAFTVSAALSVLALLAAALLVAPAERRATTRLRR